MKMLLQEVCCKSPAYLRKGRFGRVIVIDVLAQLDDDLCVCLRYESCPMLSLQGRNKGILHYLVLANDMFSFLQKKSFEWTQVTSRQGQAWGS